MVEIRHRYSGAVIKTIDGANLCGAGLSGANLCDADLRGANDAKQIVEKMVANALRSDGYDFTLFTLQNGEPHVLAGCRWFTIAAFRAHTNENYPGTPKHVETNQILDFLAARLAAQ